MENRTKRVVTMKQGCKTFRWQQRKNLIYLPLERVNFKKERRRLRSPQGPLKDQCNS